MIFVSKFSYSISTFLLYLFFSIHTYFGFEIYCEE